MKWFTIVHHDGGISVRIEDGGVTTINVQSIDDVEVVIRAINRAAREGAKSGTLFTGDVTHEQVAKMHRMRSSKGTTWLGGRVTFLEEGEQGPRFRIDWEIFPS